MIDTLQKLLDLTDCDEVRVSLDNVPDNFMRIEYVWYRRITYTINRVITTTEYNSTKFPSLLIAHMGADIIAEAKRRGFYRQLTD